MKSSIIEEAGKMATRNHGIRIPSNIRNLIPRIAGFDARKISSLIIVVMLSLIVLHFSAIFSIITAVFGILLSVIPVGDQFFPALVLRMISMRLGEKSGELSLAYDINCSDEMCFFIGRHRLFVVCKAKALPFQLMAEGEVRNEALSISSTLDKLSSDLESVAIPVMVDSERFQVTGGDDESSDYNDLISFVFNGTTFYDSYFFLSQSDNADPAKSYALLKKESRALKEGLEHVGISVEIITERSEAEEIVRKLS